VSTQKSQLLRFGDPHTGHFRILCGYAVDHKVQNIQLQLYSRTTVRRFKPGLCGIGSTSNTLDETNIARLQLGSREQALSELLEAHMQPDGSGGSKLLDFGQYYNEQLWRCRLQSLADAELELGIEKFEDVEQYRR
jgi:hypothetical protein